MDDILSNTERNVKNYLVATVAKDLVELLSIMALEKPADPHAWLGEKLLLRSRAASSVNSNYGTEATSTSKE